MNNVPVANVRNFALAGHAGSGKTTLADLMLFKAGKVGRIGSVENGTSVSDYRPEEQERTQSLFAASLNCTWKDCELFFLDTPGNSDFLGEAVAGLSVTDMAVIVLDGVNGLEFGSSRAFKTAAERGVPRAFFINSLDRDNADFDKVLGEIQEAYGVTACVPFTLPVGKQADLSGVVHVLKANDVPADLADTVEQYRSAIMDTVAESDEELMMRYLEGEELSEEEISGGLHAAILNGDLVPVFCGSAARDIGVEEFMNGVVNLFPNPVNRPPVALKEGELTPREDGPAMGLVFKSVIDPFIGQLTYIRIYSGTLTSDNELHNVSRGGKERIGQILVLNGKEQQTVDKAGPGDVIAIPKLKEVGINDTVGSAGDIKELAPIEFPKGNQAYAVYAVKKGEEDKIGQGLTRLSEEDPTVRLDRNEETHELVVYGLGDQHLQVIMGRLKANARVEVDLRTPKTPYRETIRGTGEGKYRHKKQTGGHGQFAEVQLRLEPIPNEEEDFIFANEVVGGNIPKNFIPAVEKGVVGALTDGPLAGCKVINVKAVVFDGKHHPVDSSDIAFQIASRGAFREAMSKADPILLEPIMRVRITAPDEYVGDLSGDLNQRRGRPLGMESEGNLRTIIADVPLAEMHNYSSQLRSITQGRGSFEMEFNQYEQVPGNIAKQIQEQAAKDAEDE